jgi:hypothetical protein
MRYHAALLLRLPQRWLPPLLLYAVLLAVGAGTGEPVLDSLGVGAAALLPVAAWLTRVALTAEPPAARHCAVAFAGAARVHGAGVLTALAAVTALGCAGQAVLALTGDAHATDGVTPVARGPALAAGVAAALTCALLGVALGVLAGRPLVRRPAWSVPVTVLAIVPLLAAGASPANAAIGGLVEGSVDGRAGGPLWPVPAALLAATAATALACATARRHP